MSSRSLIAHYHSGAHKYNSQETSPEHLRIQTKQWCREALRRRTFGRCSAGLCYAEEEYRGKECRSCTEIREKAMDEMNMDDFNKKRLGWNRGEDSDDDGGYGW
ncbi:hypothetical protein F5B18DRAFT_650721 [Nemania serpens]|nr:hypothetical protein F5B18DRAFT_650721 [Nemania serpens]